MDTILFRAATADDFHRVSAQIAESYRAAYREQMHDAYLDALQEDHWVPILQAGRLQGDVCLIAECRGQVVGSSVYGSSQREPGAADLHAIYLSPACTGRGLGRRLYGETERSMRARGYECCTLEVLTANHRAIAFYLDHGYAVTGTFTVEENGMCLECHTMEKQLL